jgi:hypothetical protein
MLGLLYASKPWITEDYLVSGIFYPANPQPQVNIESYFTCVLM